MVSQSWMFFWVVFHASLPSSATTFCMTLAGAVRPQHWCVQVSAMTELKKKERKTLTSHPDRGKNSQSENRSFNRDDAKATEPEHAGSFPVMTRKKNWETISWIHGKTKSSSSKQDHQGVKMLTFIAVSEYCTESKRAFREYTEIIQ